MMSPCLAGTTAGAAGAKTRHDVLSLRQWFNSMDMERSGYITKLQWTTFFTANPSYKCVFLGASPLPAGVKAEAEEFRQLVKIRKEIDHDGAGTITFDKFVRYFRECGRVVEYETENAPTDRIEAMLSDLHRDPQAMSEKQFEELDSLTKQLDGRRRSLVHEEVRGQSIELSGIGSHWVRTSLSRGEQDTPRLRSRRSATVGTGAVSPLLHGNNLRQLGQRRLASKS